METLADRLKHERNRQGWSQDDLAARAGVKQSFIGALEAGNQRTSGYLPEIANALGVDTYWLKTGKGRRQARELSDDEKLILQALPLLDSAVRDIWVQSARAAVERSKGNGQLCA